jgi:hypothetical protein
MPLDRFLGSAANPYYTFHVTVVSGQERCPDSRVSMSATKAGRIFRVEMLTVLQIQWNTIRLTVVSMQQPSSDSEVYVFVTRAHQAK